MPQNGYDNTSFVSDEGKFQKVEYNGDYRNNTTLSVATDTPTSDDEETENRATWGNSIEFLMSCISMNVGLGNIWRFPFIAYENGGGAFLIPYIIVLIVVGRPMYYLEMCLGQFVRRGNVKMYESLAPALKGVGYGQLIGNLCVASYYCSLMAITLFYLISSFSWSMPWSECNPTWANASWLAGDLECVASKSQAVNGTNNTVSSAELWYRIEALKESQDITDGIGYPEWRLTLCLLVSWIFTFAVCAKGVETSGKASYFLALFPYVILFTLLIRSVTLTGSGTGILYYLEPKWEVLLTAKVWYSAITQCFFSLNTGFGTVTMYASYNNFRHFCYRDAMIVTTMDTLTSFVAGMIIFGILGNLAFKMDVDVTDVIKSGGTGLAFVSYPEAIANFDAVPWLFAILFFFMLFVLGLGSLVAMAGSAFTVIMDSFPHLRVWHVSLGTAIVGFIIGLVYVTPGGQWIFTMVDFFGGSFIFMILNIFEIVAVSWWYGLEDICLDIEYMIKRKPGAYFRIAWGLVIPVVLIFILVYFCITFQELTYEDKGYPLNIMAWGWAILGFSVFQIPLWFAISLLQLQKKWGWKQAFKLMFSHENWRPKGQDRYIKWLQFKEKAKGCRRSFNRSWLVDKLCMLIGR